MTETAAPSTPTRDAAPVTVIIPLYNGANFIAETLTSLQHQTLRPAEVLVVDDGSLDDGLSIVRSHPLGARVVEQPHLGVAVARNHGLLLAGQPWVAYLDQDDLWLPDRLSRLMSWLQAHPDEQMVMTTERPFATDDEVAGLEEADPLVGAWPTVVVPHPAYEHIAATPLREAGPVVWRDLQALLRGPISITVSIVARADLLRMAGGFAPHALAMDDYWLFVNVARIQPIAVLDDPTVFYRVHLSATSRSTRLGLPFLSSAAALRLGGGLVPLEAVLADQALGDIHEHLLDEIQRSDSFADPRIRRVVRHLTGVLWQSPRPIQEFKAIARLKAPRLAAAMRKASSRRPG